MDLAVLRYAFGHVCLQLPVALPHTERSASPERAAPSLPRRRQYGYGGGTSRQSQRGGGEAVDHSHRLSAAHSQRLSSVATGSQRAGLLHGRETYHQSNWNNRHQHANDTEDRRIEYLGERFAEVADAREVVSRVRSATASEVVLAPWKERTRERAATAAMMRKEVRAPDEAAVARRRPTRSVCALASRVPRVTPRAVG